MTNAMAQTKSGLLLTTVSASGDAQQRFHAYWITLDGAQVQVVEGMRLLVPRKAGWWEVGITALVHANSDVRSEKLWAVPLGTVRPRSHVVPISDDDPCSDYLNTYSVSWVGSDFVAMHRDYESACGGHTVSGEQSFVTRLDDMQRKEQESRPQLTLTELAGPEARKAMDLGAELANTRAAQASAGGEAASPIAASDNSWIILRSKGRYRLLGTTPIELAKGGDSYSIPFDPPASLVGPDELAVGWDSILDKLPDALDAYTSPDGDLLVVLTPRYVSIFEVKEQKIGARLSRIAVESSSAIAAQWATGANVDRWSETIVPALKAAPYTPQK